ncbi:right-handed parallel beta-helix repeat-containing protein [Clostridium sp. C2-6-12]|uniref:right-handed parallel beta-helix repeat-containing protein n=1 Tax=Clostridium sp. C2-6-12 TaxID=2698832 RepID=UPI00136DAB30|nr:right-handed parallel beta-helix repeat-containing protein [Clostridium sp. C2-6-12]
MINKTLFKIIATSLMLTSIFVFTPISAKAEWKHNNKGWWYIPDTCATGWWEINGNWYYFYSDGYMAHGTVIDGFKLGSNGAWIKTEPATSDEKITEVTVGTAAELVSAIGSNKKIVLKPGTYNLSTITQTDNSNKSVTWETVTDGKELNVQNIHNLTIEGMTSGKVEIKVEPRYANIINFSNVQNITIKNIVAGHTPSKYECNAGVLKFSNSNNISVDNSELYGCGSIGLDLNSVRNLTFSNSKIDHCSLRAVEIRNSNAIKFSEAKLVNNEAFSNIIAVDNSQNITFEKCEMTDNNNFGWSFIEATQKSNVLLDKCIIKNNSQSTDPSVRFDKVYFFNTNDYSGTSDSKIILKDSQISNNKSDFLLTNTDNVSFDNCTTNTNSWN